MLRISSLGLALQALLKTLVGALARGALAMCLQMH